MGEMSMSGEILMVYPDRMKGKITMPMGEIEIVLKGEEGWMVVPGRGSMPLPQDQIKTYNDSFFRDPVIYFTHYKEWDVQYIGKRKLGDKDTEDILITLEDYSFHLLLDIETTLPAGLVYTEIGQQGPAEKVETFFDYKKINGIHVPMKTMSTADGKKESETVIESIEFNVDVKPEVFEKE